MARSRLIGAHVATHDIVVLGASAGGLDALQRLCAALSPELSSSLFIVQHISASSRHIPEILARASTLPLEAPEDRAPFQPGRIYVAPPDRHMLLERNIVRVVRGPKENRHRPAIDPLFRSAAWSYGPRVVGVVLTGTLGDGAAGLWAIRSCGGKSIVQDPADASYAGMPRTALAFVDVDHCVPLSEIAPLILRLSQERASDEKPRQVPTAVAADAGVAMNDKDIPDMDLLGQP